MSGFENIGTSKSFQTIRSGAFTAIITEIKLEFYNFRWRVSFSKNVDKIIDIFFMGIPIFHSCANPHQHNHDDHAVAAGQHQEPHADFS